MDDKSLSVNDPNREGMLVTYALPRYGFSLMLTCADFIVLFLYTEVYALSGLLAGVAAGMGKVAIALSTFLGGYLSDRTQTRWGKRRPFLLLGSPILMITFIFLLIPTFIIGYQTPEIIVFLWYLLFNCLFQAFYGILWAAYHALMPAFAKVHERPKTSMWQNIFNYLATGTGVIYTFLGVTVFTNRYEETGVLEPAFAWVFIGFGSVIVILLYLMHFRIPLAEDEFEKSGGNFVEEMHVIRENKNYLWLIVFHGVTGLTTAMQTVLLLGFSEKVLKLEGIRLYTIAVLLILGILFFVGIWRKLIEVKGKKVVLKYILLFQIAFMPLSLVGLYQGDMFFFAMFFVLGLTCGIAGWALFPYIIYADVSEDYLRQKGEDKTGLFYGFAMVPLNLFQALSLVITGLLLELPEVAGTDFSWGYILWGPLGAVYVLIALVLLVKFVKLDYEWER